MGTTIGVIKGDTRSLDYSSCVCRIEERAEGWFSRPSAGCVFYAVCRIELTQRVHVPKGIWDLGNSDYSTGFG